MSDAQHPPRPAEGRLNDLWDKPVRDLVLLADPALGEPQRERHRIYSLLTMALVAR